MINRYVFVVVFFALGCSKTKNYPEVISADKLLSIELGMTKEEVINILGQPVSKDLETFEYSTKALFNYPMIWIHFDSIGVKEVYVKKYYFFDDKGIYGLKKDKKSEKIYRWGEGELNNIID